ncbi:GDSL esterase/lipase 7-like [Mangifera indica]|uniref:GDSL esterase/lipase 7-like n=1 Tax=Mangifera indica TaxID=29780 RepID=UPI001CFB060C|nr:GDSL esterase/lipase 7-like [Mangifera indica]
MSVAAIIFCIGVLELAGHVHGRPSTNPLTPALFIFGDSLMDCGNNNYIPTMARANYFPYGIDFGHPTGRFCNGLTAADYITRHLGLPLIPPYLSPMSKGRKILNGLNYASAAAGILDETGQTYGARTTFNEQILQFEGTISLDLQSFFKNPDELNRYIAKSVFLISIGSNDYINNYLQPNSYPSSKFYSGEGFADLLINIFSIQLSTLYRLGARKMAVVGVGPLGCIPNQLSTANGKNSCIKKVNDLAAMFNSRLIQLINTLNASLPGSFFIYHNTYDLIYDMVTSPSRYGFVVPNRACCGNGRYGGNLTCLPQQQPCANRNQYIFWDPFHPTQAVNAIVARSCHGKSATKCYPISIDHLAQL